VLETDVPVDTDEALSLHRGDHEVLRRELRTVGCVEGLPED